MTRHRVGTEGRSLSQPDPIRTSHAPVAQGAGVVERGRQSLCILEGS